MSLSVRVRATKDASENINASRSSLSIVEALQEWFRYQPTFADSSAARKPVKTETFLKEKTVGLFFIPKPYFSAMSDPLHEKIGNRFPPQFFYRSSLPPLKNKFVNPTDLNLQKTRMRMPCFKTGITLKLDFEKPQFQE